MLDIGGFRRTNPPADWRGGASAVAMLTFDVDADAPLLAAGEEYAAHLSTMSHQAYGPQVGVGRVLDLLARHGKEATFFFPGLTAERWPATVERVLAAGHEVALHGYTHRSPTQLTDDEQRRELERGLDALRRSGAEPAGYRAPMWSTTVVTMEALADLGLRYDSSLFDDDRPYVLRAASGSIAELPVHWSLDDWEQYMYVPAPDLGHVINRPSAVAELWIEELDAMRSTGSLCVLTCHPFLSGRPSRLRAVERFIEAADGFGDVAFMRAGSLADQLLSMLEPTMSEEEDRA